MQPYFPLPAEKRGKRREPIERDSSDARPLRSSSSSAATLHSLISCSHSFIHSFFPTHHSFTQFHPKFMNERGDRMNTRGHLFCWCLQLILFCCLAFFGCFAYTVGIGSLCECAREFPCVRKTKRGGGYKTDQVSGDTSVVPEYTVFPG